LKNSRGSLLCGNSWAACDHRGLWSFSRLFTLLLLLVSCSHKGVDLRLHGASDLNLDEKGSPLPVVIRVYQLTQVDGVEGVEFKHLWKNDSGILKETLLARQEITLLPDSDRTMQITLKEETNYLMVMALFRKPTGNEWRKIIPVRKPAAKSVKIELTQQQINLIPDDSAFKSLRKKLSFP